MKRRGSKYYYVYRSLATGQYVPKFGNGGVRVREERRLRYP
jgi:hypothetical protein